MLLPIALPALVILLLYAAYMVRGDFSAIPISRCLQSICCIWRSLYGQMPILCNAEKKSHGIAATLCCCQEECNNAKNTTAQSSFCNLEERMRKKECNAGHFAMLRSSFVCNSPVPLDTDLARFYARHLLLGFVYRSLGDAELSRPPEDYRSSYRKFLVEKQGSEAGVA